MKGINISHKIYLDKYLDFNYREDQHDKGLYKNSTEQLVMKT